MLTNKTLVLTHTLMVICLSVPTYLPNVIEKLLKNEMLSKRNLTNSPRMCEGSKLDISSACYEGFVR